MNVKQLVEQIYNGVIELDNIVPDDIEKLYECQLFYNAKLEIFSAYVNNAKKEIQQYKNIRIHKTDTGFIGKKDYYMSSDFFRTVKQTTKQAAVVLNIPYTLENKDKLKDAWAEFVRLLEVEEKFKNVVVTNDRKFNTKDLVRNHTEMVKLENICNMLKNAKYNRNIVNDFNYVEEFKALKTRQSTYDRNVNSKTDDVEFEVYVNSCIGRRILKGCTKSSKRDGLFTIFSMIKGLQNKNLTDEEFNAKLDKTLRFTYNYLETTKEYLLYDKTRLDKYKIYIRKYDKGQTINEPLINRFLQKYFSLEV